MNAPSRPRGRSLPQAIATAVVLILAMIGSYLLGRPAFFVLICIVVLTALFEALDALVQSGHRPNVPLGVAAGLAMLVISYEERFAYLSVVVTSAMLGGWLVALRPNRGASAATDVAWMVMALVWVGGGGAAATAIMMIDPGGLALLVSFVAIAALDDIGAYFVGTFFGSHKLAPSISPGKSWEGAFGGVPLALLGGVVVGILVDELTIAHGLAIGGICSITAPAGDLVESLFKREMGVKDSGRLLPGHGGLLDRLDAIILSAPAVYLYLRIAVA